MQLDLIQLHPSMYKSYQAEQVMLSDEMKKKREDEIIKKEKEAKELQKKRFGFEGDLFKRRQELVKPVQDKVYNAVSKKVEKVVFFYYYIKKELKL